MQQTALLTGISGQDASYAAEELLKRGFEVYALVRYSARGALNGFRLMEHPRLHLVTGDLTDSHSIDGVFRSSPQFDWILNYGALSPVWRSWKEPALYLDVNAGGVVRLLECMRRYCPGGRFFQAGSSEQFGAVKQTPQDEDTPFNPRSPYAVSKVAAHWYVNTYRESYGLFAVVALGFNHCSPRRGEGFVTQKIVTTAARIKLGLEREIKLGRLDTSRDWGFAGDYVRANIKMLEADTPKDYVVATGQTHTVKEFAELAFGHFGLDFKSHYVLDEAMLRPAEVHLLRGNARRIKKDLGWEPSIRCKKLVAMMADAAIKRETAKMKAGA